MSDPVVSRLVRGRTALIAVAIMIVVSGMYGAWWSIVAAETETAIENWIDQRRSEGWKIDFDQLSTDGFPFAVHIRVTKPHVTAGSWQWRGDDLNITGTPWSLGAVKFDLSGSHRGQMVVDENLETFTLQADALDGTATLKNGYLQGLQSKGEGLHLRLEGRDQDFSLAELEAEGEQQDPVTLNWGLRIRSLQLPKSLHVPLGPRLQHLDAKGQLAGRLSGDTLKGILSNWRDGGGRLNVTMLDMNYMPLRVAGDGTFALDSALQPVGVFFSRARGVMKTVDTLVDSGLIKSMESLATKLVLAALSKTPEGGGERYLELPLTLENRTLSAGPFKLLRFRPIRW